MTFCFFYSPVIITDDANVKIAAKRVMWGKLYNSGQTCIAPDYILATSPAIRDKFVESCRSTITSFFGNVSSMKRISDVKKVS